MVNPYQKLLNELENEKQVIMCTRGVTNPETTKRTIEKSVFRNGDLQTEQFDEKTKTITAVIDQGLPKFNTSEEGAFVLCEPFCSEGRQNHVLRSVILS